MADIEVTLNHYENYSSSTAKKYRGYVINSCDNSKVDDGTWSPTSYDGIGVSIDENKITVWNTNTTGSSVSNTFTWTSSYVSGCTKTLSVTVPGAVVNLKSGNTEIVVTAYYSTSTGDYSIYPCQDEFLINGSSNGIVTTSNTVSASPIITCKGGMSEYWANYAQHNTNNKIHVSVNPDMRTYFIGCTGDYTATGANTINLKYYDREMTISFPVTFKFIRSEKDYCPSVSIELYDNSNNVISGTSTPGNNIHIKITINNWKDIPESNKKKFDYFENGGNNIIYSLPDGYVMGFNSWDGSNNFNIIGGLSDECPEGDYTFSVTVCDNTVSKTITKSITHQELPCPDFYVSESDFTIYPYESKIIRLHINNWNSTTTITDYTFTKYFDIIVNSRKNMTYSVGSYNDIDEYYPITITHEFNETNDSSDKLDITIYSNNGNCDNSANIKCHLKIGYFNVTFNTNGAIPYGKNVEVFIDCNGVKQRVAEISGPTSPLNQRAQIWHSSLDTGSNAAICPSRSFTVFIGDYTNVTSAVITSATSGTIDNTCKSDDFNITCNVIF